MQDFLWAHWTQFRYAMYQYLFNDFIVEAENRHRHTLSIADTALGNASAALTDAISKIDHLEANNDHLATLLAAKNANAVSAQQLYITKHAVHRYRERIGFTGSDKDLREYIYKQTIKHLATMDKLPDGHYKIDSRAAVRVADSTVQTVVPAKKRQS